MKTVINQNGVVSYYDDNGIEITGPVNFSGPVTLPFNTIVPSTFLLVQKSSNYQILITDYTVECVSNSFIVTLPTSVGNSGKVFNIKNSGSGTITINTTDSQTIDVNASGSITLLQYDCLTVQSNNVNWILL